MIDRLRQDDGLEILVNTKAFKFSETFFPYTSGQIGPYFVNSEAVLQDGDRFVQAVNLMRDNVRNTLEYGFDAISGGESRDWIFSLPLAYALNKPHLSIYKNGKTLGPEIRGKKFVHVADLNNEGSSVEQKWVPTIRDMNGEIEDVFFFVDRLEDGVFAMEKAKVKSHAVVPLDENAWESLKRKYGILNDETYNNIRRRMEDKNSWAREMLLSEEGILRMRYLLQNPVSHEKALGVLKYYKEIESEITERLNSKFGEKLVKEWLAGN